MKKILVILPIFVLVLLFSSNLKAQSDLDSTEINWSVKELFDFHEVIYQIWHEAFPAKDIEKLKSFVPEVRKHMEKINNAKLPGIVSDKENKWKEGLTEFNASAEEYYTAAAGNNEQAMLDAAEKLHAKFEMMVRVIKPVMKEIDQYHQILYLIYHKYLPAKDYNSISGVIDELIGRAEKIKEGKIPKKIEGKTEEFLKVTDELINATKELKETLSTNDGTKIDAAVEVMHTKYMKLEQFFD